MFIYPRSIKAPWVRSRTDNKKFDFIQYDHQCLVFRITIGDAKDEQTGDLTIRYTTGSDVCNVNTEPTEEKDRRRGGGGWAGVAGCLISSATRL